MIPRLICNEQNSLTPAILFRYPLRAVRKVFSMTARKVIGTITHVSTTEPLVALTFDDGPHAEYTPRLLDILESYHARGTFFMIGEAAQAHPELVRRIAAGGHAIGNHSWNHPSFPLITGRERRAQIRQCASVLAPYGERLFRPPYGEQNIASRLDALLLGYQSIMFNIATDDWCGGDVVSIVTQIERQIRPGSVVVLHDRLFDVLQEAYFDREAMLEAVRLLLSRLGDRFHFVTVPELLRRGRPQKEIWSKAANLQLLNRLVTKKGPGRRYVQHATGGPESLVADNLRTDRATSNAERSGQSERIT
jgi:peptidoglycan/xylan/chitin deacetylase (PgdA/CDA1 family)